jgi:hypothetical protein
MHRTPAVMLLLLVGCSGEAPPAIPPTAGDFIKNNNGVGTAQVLGIDFRVSAESGGASTTDALNADFIAPDQSSARKRFSIGDDVAIQLDSVNESVVSFHFNDRDYGQLNVGDQVVIDGARNVEVNGIRRSPQ